MDSRLCAVFKRIVNDEDVAGPFCSGDAVIAWRSRIICATGGIGQDRVALAVLKSHIFNQDIIGMYAPSTGDFQQFGAAADTPAVVGIASWRTRHEVGALEGAADDAVIASAG